MTKPKKPKTIKAWAVKKRDVVRVVGGKNYYRTTYTCFTKEKEALYFSNLGDKIIPVLITPL